MFWGATCDDFYVSNRLFLKLDLAPSRETVLHFFDQIRKEFPSMIRMRRREDEVVILEEEAGEKTARRWIRIEPSPVLRISYTIDFEHPSIGRQSLEISELDRAVFERELAGARTFGFLEEVDALWRAGLARGGSLANTVVLDDQGVVNEEGLRFADEFVRHKVLDLIGDLALLGMPLRGHVRVERGGHALHQKLVGALRLAGSSPS